MKNCYYKFTLIFSFILFLFSCKEKSSHSYYSIIPENAPLVLAFTPEDIFKKAEMKEKWINYIHNQGNNEEVNKRIEEILRNGKESGIATNEKFYVFALESRNFNFGLVAKVDNINKLTETLKAFTDYGDSYGAAPVKSGDYYRAAFSNDVVCVYDAHKILCLTVNSSREKAFADAIELIQKDTTGSVINVPGFKEMEKKNEDIVLLAQMDQIRGLQLPMPGISKDQIKGMDLLVTLDFKKGQLNLNYKLFGNDDVINALEEQQKNLFGKVKNEFADFFPENTLAYMTGNIKGEEFYKSMEKEGTFYYLSEREKNDVETVLKSIDGDVAVGITSVTAFGTPSFLLYADVKDVNVPSTLSKIDFGSMGDMSNLGNNRYEYKMRYFPLSVYFGMQNNNFYATNDASLYGFIGEKPNNTFKDTKFNHNLKNTNFGIVVNTKEVLNLPAVGASLQMMGINMGFYRAFLSEFSYVEMLVHDNIEMSINFYLNNDNENSLKVIADKIL